jgi:GNAT superfamily N-acetyltransferase
MNIRDATHEDNAALQMVMAQCPQDTGLVVAPLNTPDFFARAKVYETYKVYVAEKDGEIVGSAACALRNVLINGTLQEIGFEFQYFTAPPNRRHGVGTRLRQRIEQYFIQQGAAWSSAIIVSGNVPSMRFFESQGFSPHSDLIISTMLVYKGMPEAVAENVRAATREDVGSVAKLMNETWGDYDFYAPTSAEALLRFVDRTPIYDLSDVFLLEVQSELVACVGVWDCSRIMKITINELNPALRIMGSALDIMRISSPCRGCHDRGKS